jgi:hypothetical protein
MHPEPIGVHWLDGGLQQYSPSPHVALPHVTLPSLPASRLPPAAMHPPMAGEKQPFEQTHTATM